MSHPAKVPTDAGATLSETARTIISLLLFVHLVALAVVFLDPYPIPAASYYRFNPAAREDLLPRLKSVFRVYLHPLWLDRPLQYRLTWGNELDFDQYLEVELTDKDGTAVEPAMRLPDDAWGLGFRRQRYHELARVFGAGIQGEPPDELLPLSVGGGLIKQNDSARAQVRLFRQSPLILPELWGGQSVSQRRPPDRLFAADVFFLTGLDRPQMNRITEARDVAPVTSPSGDANERPAGEPTPAGEETPPAKSVLKSLLPPTPLPNRPIPSPPRQSDK